MPTTHLIEPVSFADIYDVLYGNAAEFRGVQLAYLSNVFGAPPAKLLDAGCGTGEHLRDLAAAGYCVVGLDADPRMLQITCAKLVAAGRSPAVVRGDLRALPFASVFDGILCLESPLAYLLGDSDLSAALIGLRRSLRPDGQLVIDVFDYPGTLGEEGLRSRTSRFQAPWGHVVVRESHHHDRHAGIWIMRQEFRAGHGRTMNAFSVEHRLRVRSADDYARALEDAGFTVVACQAAYPGAPPENEDERRLIFVAQASGRR